MTERSVERDAWTRVTAERNRQVMDEGWHLNHDDQHINGELLRAAVIYIWHGTMMQGAYEGGLPMGWPWDAEWWKPKDRARNLERAGALCLAEHDRLVRAGEHTGPADHKLGIVLRELGSLLACNAHADLVEALQTIAAPIEGTPIGDPWDFYRDLQEVARAALNKVTQP